MKLKEINHEPDMIFASPPMRLAGSPDVHDRQASMHEPAALEHAHVRTEDEVIGHEEIASAGHDSAAAETIKISISFFQPDPVQPASANIEFSGEKHHLNFTTADLAEDRLFPICSTGWKEWYCEGGGDKVREEGRALGRDGSPKQYFMSPIYLTGDTFGRKPPLEDALVIVDWADIGVPEAIVVVLRKRLVTIPMTRFSKGERNRPTFKGQAIIRAED